MCVLTGTWYPADERLALKTPITSRWGIAIRRARQSMAHCANATMVEHAPPHAAHLPCQHDRAVKL